MAKKKAVAPPSESPDLENCDGVLVEGCYVKRLDGADSRFPMEPELGSMPVLELLRAWRNDADELVSMITGSVDSLTRLQLKSRLLIFSLASLAVMRRGKVLFVKTPRLAKLRATMADLRETNPDVYALPGLFALKDYSLPAAMQRLRVAIRTARSDVDEIEVVQLSQKPKRVRPHANGTLDVRALRRAVELQRTNPGWSLQDLATELKTHVSSLIGKRRGKPRCPLFWKYWQEVQAGRQEQKLERQGLPEKGRRVSRR